MEGCGGDTDIRGDAADVDVGDVLFLDDVLQARLGQLHVVEEGGVGVHVRVGALQRKEAWDRGEGRVWQLKLGLV